MRRKQWKYGDRRFWEGKEMSLRPISVAVWSDGKVTLVTDSEPDWVSWSNWQKSHIVQQFSYCRGLYLLYGGK